MERLTKRDFVFNSHYVANKLQSWSIAQCLKKLQEYENAEEDGCLFIPPCVVGERWRDTRGEVFTVDGFHCDKWAGWSILYHYEDGEDCACNPIYFKAHYTREETEQALKEGAE